MEFNGDGKIDLLSGSWPGELYLFRGEGGGRFGAGETIKDKAGKPIQLGSASTAFACDWNGDGRLDLLVGDIDGSVHFVPNEGKNGKHAFRPAGKVSAAGAPVKVDSDSQPIAADWDADGRLDLLVGAGDGSVAWFRNRGSRSAPELETARTLLPPGDMGFDQAAAPPGDRPAGSPRRGGRAKICVTDWNGDGRADLLVGDFKVVPRDLSEADRNTYQESMKRYEELARRLQPYYNEANRLRDPPGPATASADAPAKLEALRKRYQKDLDALAEAIEPLRRLSPSQPDGNVWVILASPGEPTTTGR